MFGPVTTVDCRTRNLNGAEGVEDFGATAMEFAGGLHGQLTSIWHRMMGRPSNRRIEVFAENLFVASDADTLGPIVFQRGSGANEETIADDVVMAKFTEKILRERPYLAPIKDRPGRQPLQGERIRDGKSTCLRKLLEGRPARRV